MANDDRSPTDAMLDASREGPRGTEKGRVTRLGELDDYQVAEGEPDVCGWKVKTPDGHDAGNVESLIVDLGALRVSYLEVKLDREALRLAQSRNVLVPIEAVWLDDDREVVNVALTPTDLIAAPAYDPRSFSAFDHEALQRRYAGRAASWKADLDLYKRRRLPGHVRAGQRAETERVERR